jgi:TPR repeat protein
MRTWVLLPVLACRLAGFPVSGHQQPELASLLAAAERGNRDAQFTLGMKYQTGSGVLQDPVRAVAWFREAAERGLLEAQFRLGLAYGTGEGVAPDDAAAVEWFRKAAEKGHAKAEYMLGVAYYRAKAVDRAPLIGLDWFRKSAMQDYAPAQFVVAISFHPTPGEIDAAGSVQLLRKAAEHGNPDAQQALGAALATALDNPLADPDKGPARDDVEAHVWFDLCARHVPTAEERTIAIWEGGLSATGSCTEARNQLRRRMTPEQISEAEGRAIDWLARNAVQ